MTTVSHFPLVCKVTNSASHLMVQNAILGFVQISPRKKKWGGGKVFGEFFTGIEYSCCCSLLFGGGGGGGGFVG